MARTSVRSSVGAATPKDEAFARLHVGALARLLCLALALQIGPMRAFVGLDVLESALGIPDGVESLASAAAVRCAFCFACHIVTFSLFGCLFTVPKSLSGSRKPVR